MPVSPPPDLTLLLAETRWLGGLARCLAADPSAADDLAQETLATALERPPATDRPLRGWLATVLQRRARDEHRAQSARQARERSRARPEQQPATIDVVAKAELQGQLVQAVLALDEPYRTCVLLRFFENLPPRAIARQTATPVATVHSRLQRAIELLRTRLGRRRQQWLALAPLVVPHQAAGPLILGVPIVNAFGKVALGAAVVVLSCAWWWWQQDAAPGAGATAADAGSVAAASAGSGERADVSAAAAERTQVQTPPAAEPPPAEPPPAPLLRGRVIDVAGRGLAGVLLRCEGEGTDLARAVSVTSAAGGQFEFAPPPGARAVVADDPRWSTVLSGAVRIAPENESLVIVGSRLHVHGRVVDQGGAPLAGAEVEVRMPRHLGADLGILLDFSLSRAWRTTTDERGAFAFADVPLVEQGMVHGSLGGYAPSSAPLVADPAPLTLVLARPAGNAGIVRGVVRAPGGSPVQGARVSAGADIAWSDARGEFALEVGNKQLMGCMVAVAAGYQPAVLESARTADGARRWPEPVVLQLGATPLAIAGRVVDGAGKPVHGAEVWIADPLYLGHDGTDVLLAETLLSRTDRPFRAFVATDQSGRFRLEGLSDRPYALRALDPRTLVLTARDGIPAGGAGVELVLAEPVFVRVRGRVLARDGTPLPGVSVKVQRPALEVQVPGGTRDEWVDRPAVTTDAAGSFAFADVPQRDVEIFAWGDTILFAGRMLAAHADVDDFVVTADRRVHLQVELSPPVDRADTLRVLDSAGKPMLLRIMRGDTSFTNRKAAIADGRSQVISLGEGAAQVVLLRGEREVGRVPVQLLPGPIHTITF